MKKLLSTILAILGSTSANAYTTTVTITSDSPITVDVSGTIPPPSAATTTSLWKPTDTPKALDGGDTSAGVYGVQFTPQVAGNATGCKFYKGATNTGTHVCTLWSNSGAQLATVTFTGETASGWQTQNFNPPVALTANTQYVIGVYDPLGHYSDDASYFNSPYISAVDGQLVAPATASTTNGHGNGVYAYTKTATTFPTSTYSASNYWTDVVFQYNGGAVTPPPVGGGTPPPIDGGGTPPPIGGNAGSVPFTALHTYFMSPTGSDSNNGTSAGSPWKTPNHSGLVCGDVIVAAAGNYSSSWGGALSSAPGSCPSSTGGIDGAGGVYFVTLLCAGNLGSCTLTGTAGYGDIVPVTASNWAVEGFQVTSTNIQNTGMRGFMADAYTSGTVQIHHIAFINDIAYHVQAGFSTNDGAVNHNVPGNGVDEYAVVGSIAQNAANDTICLGAIDDVSPSASYPYAGTHIFFYGDFSYNTQVTNGCSYDEETILFDTMDAHQYTGQTVALNNMAWSSYRYGIAIYNQQYNTLPATLKQYVLNNTTYNNDTLNVGNYADVNLQSDNAGSVAIIVENNISHQPHANPCALLEGSANGPASMVNIVLGATGRENIAFAATTANAVCVYNGGLGGTNFIENPGYANVTDLLNNQSGPPNCSAFTNTTACMGWNANTSTLTTPSAISDLKPSSAHSAGKGYQLASTTCGPVNAPDGTALYPAWLKGVVYLHWNGSSLTENNDLVTKPCGM